MSDESFHDFRRKGVGGSDANILMSGDAQKIEDLRLEKRGEKESPDFSGVLPVQMGIATEEFNAKWYALKTGFEVKGRGTRAVHPKFNWMRCNLDGYIPGAVWEAKHVGDRFSMDEILERYMPQLQHNMAVTGLDQAVLSVFFGNAKWDSRTVEADPFYQEDLFKLEERFWLEGVLNDASYLDDPPPPPPKAIDLDAMREVSMTGNNEWAVSAHDWVEHGAAAKLFDKADKALRQLVEDDVKLAYGHGVQIKRAKDGKLRISKEKE